MNKIWDLIKNEKVEWKKLGEVFEIRNGYTPYKNNPDYWKDGVYNWFRLDDLKEQGSVLKKSKQKITKEAVKGSGLFKKNSFLLSTTATIGQFGLLYEDSLANQQFTNLSVKKEYENTISVEFLLHYFYEISEWCINNSNLSTFKKVNINELKELKIPIPSIDTQNKIVKILDKFNIYVKELERELEHRNKQYQHYRDMLLSENYLESNCRNNLMNVDREIKWKKLRDVCSIERGTRIIKKELISNGIYPVISGGVEPMGYFNKSNRDANTITIAQYGSAGFVNWQSEKFWANDVCYSLLPNETIINKYLFYFLKSKQEYIYSISNKTAIPYSIDKESILNIEIPIPSLDIQNRIVKILDKFSELSENTKGLLPKEIQQRQEQYKYYRDKLLVFDNTHSPERERERRCGATK